MLIDFQSIFAEIANWFNPIKAMPNNAPLAIKYNPAVYPNPLNVSDAEWRAVDSQNFSEKWRREDSGLPHSFINLQGLIGAMDNKDHDYDGRGGFGKVKKMQTRNGKILALKIQKVPVDEIELEVLQRTGNLIAYTYRDLPQEKEQLLFSPRIVGNMSNAVVKRKYYIAMPYAPGKDLSALLETPLTERQKLDIAIETCIAMQEKIHQCGVLHGDIKPGNLRVDLRDNQVIVTPIDLGNAFPMPGDAPYYKHTPYIGKIEGARAEKTPEGGCRILADIQDQDGNKQTIIDNVIKEVRTPGHVYYVTEYGKRCIITPNGNVYALPDGDIDYLAPERIYEGKTYFASDVYSLGILMQKDLGLSPELYQDLVAEKPEDRPSLNEVIARLHQANIALQEKPIMPVRYKRRSADAALEDKNRPLKQLKMSEPPENHEAAKARLR